MNPSEIKILIVEDELIVAEELRELLIQHGYHVTAVAANAKSALFSLNEEAPDLVLMDINIKGDLDGIDLARMMNAKSGPGIIFLTAYHDKKFIDRAKKAKPAGYLVKPYDERSLLAAIEIAFSNLNKEPSEGIQKEFIFVKNNDTYVKVKIEDILYVKADGSYVEVYIEKEERVLAMNLKNFEARLNDNRFVRIHRSYMVNIERIDGLEDGFVHLGKHSIPCSGTYRNQLINRLKLI